jgi:endo-1,4-beta-xylanase
MRAEKSFGCLAAAMLAMVATLACSPIVRRDLNSGAGGDHGGDPAGGAMATGGDPGSGGVTDTGGDPGTGGGVMDSGGSPGLGGVTGAGGVTGMGGEGLTGGTTSTGGIVAVTGGSSGSGLGGTTSAVCGLGTSYGWNATGSLMDPVSDGSHQLVGIKAPSVVFYNSRYHVFATVLNTAASPTIEHIQFVDWPNASSATVEYLDNTAAFGTGRSQPQVFYHQAKKTWYLVSQASGPGYSTNADVTLTSGWTKPTNFYASTPTIVTQNAGAGGVGWTDFWVICDSSNCYLFFVNTVGYLFRAQTTAGNFPNGFGDPVVVMQSANTVGGGARVYKVNGGSGGYLMLIEGKGSGGVFVGAWSATALDGKWTALAESEANPFAGKSNANYGNNQWTWDVGHGELVRSGYDETMTIENCNFRYLYAGKDHFSTAKAEPYPWKLGLLVRSK